MLDIYAGKNALQTIRDQGFKQELFTHFLGASGGPKWFSLFGLDTFLFGEFFKHRQQPLDIIGSSAGAFRAACFAQNDPVEAIKRLAKYYSETVYSDKVTPSEITQKARQLLDQVLATSGSDAIINNPIFRAHFIVAKSSGLVSLENKTLQLLGLLKSYGLNRINRRLLAKQYQRFVFANPASSLVIKDDYHFATHFINLSPKNLKDALLASGSIPLVMQGIKNIAGAPPGMYRDGGIIDYHFDIEIQNTHGLTLYPHFSAKPKAGWFDKNLDRSINTHHYRNTVMLVPSKQFIQTLPFGKIPDREDFTQLNAHDRIKYWQTVLAETEKLADSFQQFLAQAAWDKIKAM